MTLKELAAYCGVSVASASKALNHGTDISSETAMRIRAAAEELGYHPNAAARALKTNRSHNIGVLFEDDTHCGLTHEYFVEILNAVKERVEQSGYDVTFISKHLSNSTMSFLEHCRYRNCDGVVIACVDFTDPSVAELANSRIPVVTIDYTYDGIGAVLSDNARGMSDLLRYVYSKGHKKIAFMHGEMTAVTRLRLAAFFRFCDEMNLQIPEKWLLQGRYHDADLSAKLTRQLIKGGDMPTCILYPDDISLLGGTAELNRAGLRIPEDISVAGYDGISLSRLVHPVLTTLKQDGQLLGTRAAELLIKAIESPKTYIPAHKTVIGSVQPGGTVGVPKKD